ncbi:thioredoxin [Agrobacterium rubi]|uniref:Thioredoxin n=1 Tax=Agrobacterium rubi TaxID=28099 RepID=A0AAE7URN4_9HYPH|nr:thioredoxin [Agrobacterium rubi]NTE88890.1 thioredoxin [Agrobacterium rubi]NTF04718.1 thioredoxin [Agrobacterium rubi]NTF10242.1 thioredoxin [Agrobacterium rubi]NTF21580.1 thioredoxin [Agrobacterium rubi]NTF28437.1 thioredoxin [Agrobacterium rubi]
MSGTNNPYGTSMGGQMTGSVQYANAPTTAEAPAGGYIKDTTTAAFSKDVMEESRRQPVLVDFWAPWCGPCKQLTPVLEKVVNEAGGRVKLVKLNIDDHPSIPGQLGIQSIPAIVAFQDGRPVDGFMGAVPESQIKEFIDKIAGPAGNDPQAEIDAALAEAKQLFADGDHQGAAQLFGFVMQVDPDNAQAVAGIAECMIAVGDYPRASDLLGALSEELRADAAVQAALKKLAQYEEAKALGDPTALERELAANPDNHEARMKLAKILNAQGRRDEAAEQLLTVMRKDRTFEDDGARKQLVEFFESWGFKDPASVTGRRKLSSILFS